MTFSRTFFPHSPSISVFSAFTRYLRNRGDSLLCLGGLNWGLKPPIKNLYFERLALSPADSFHSAPYTEQRAAQAACSFCRACACARDCRRWTTPAGAHGGHNNLASGDCISSRQNRTSTVMGLDINPATPERYNNSLCRSGSPQFGWYLCVCVCEPT